MNQFAVLFAFVNCPYGSLLKKKKKKEGFDIRRTSFMYSFFKNIFIKKKKQVSMECFQEQTEPCVSPPLSRQVYGKSPAGTGVL